MVHFNYFQYNKGLVSIALFYLTYRSAGVGDSVFY